jgi:hypothetical protein
MPGVSLVRLVEVWGWTGVTLKFDVREDTGGYALHVDTAQTNIEIGATEGELRRLLVDLTHEFDAREVSDSGGGKDGS